MNACDLTALLAQVEQASAAAKASVAKHADPDCGCMFCEQLREVSENLGNAAFLLAEAIDAERQAQGEPAA